MSRVEIEKRLSNLDKFTGAPNAFKGIVEPKYIDGNELHVVCTAPSGSSFEDTWDLHFTVNGFLIGEYKFIET